MRRALIPLCLLLLLLVPQADVSSPSGRVLVAIDGGGPRLASRLLDDGVVVLRDLGGYLVALAAPADLATFARLSLDYRILDDAPAGKTFYVATAPGRSRIDDAAARVSMRSPYGDVIEATPDDAARLAGEGVELARLFMTPMRASAPRAVAPRAAPAQADPFIQTLVDSVSIDRINATVQRMQDFVNRYALGDSVYSARDWVVSRFHAAGIDSVTLQPFDSLYAENVVAVKPGVGHPERQVVIGAHYDSISRNFDVCPGADDDASGVACLLECARLLAPHDFDYTIVFVAFCGEEEGLVGSEAYAAAAAARGDDVVGMIQVDMIGYVLSGDATDLDIVSNESSQWLRDLLMDVAGLYHPGIPVVDGSLPGGANSDHASFWRHGYDAIMFWEDTGNHSPYIHTENDVVGLSYNSPALAKGSVRTAVATLATLADPFRVVVLHTPLANTTEVHTSHAVDVDILHAAPLDADSLVVVYTVSGVDVAGSAGAPAVSGPFTAPLIYLGHDNAYEAHIPPVSAGAVVDYYIDAADVNGAHGYNPRTAPADRHRFVVGTPTVVIEDDFETDTGWTAGLSGDNAVNGVWERAAPVTVLYSNTVVVPDSDHTAAPGTMCYVTQNAEPGNVQSITDVDNGRTTLLSPSYDLSGYGNAWVVYYRWYTNDTGFNKDDTWRVDVSNDGGASWVNIESTEDSERDWVRVERYLGDFVALTGDVRLRFVADDTLSSSIVEALVDDFQIVTYTGDAVTTKGDSPPGVTLGQNYPNPFNPGTTIPLRVSPGARATLRIYDVAGRLVATLLDNEPVAGARTVGWNARDRFGNDVASGVYFYRLDSAGHRLTRKMIVLR